MSFRVVGRMLRCFGIAAFLWFAAPTWCQAQQACSFCTTPTVSCGPTCQSNHCPPPYKYTYEGGPRIHWHCGCPHPVCNPCDLPHWGYYETCWLPYPFPPNWTHCPSAPPAAFVNLDPNVHPNLPAQTPRTGFGTPRPGTPPTPGFPMPSGAGPNGDLEEIPLETPRRFDGGR